MLIRSWRFVTILFVSLSVGMAFCHLLQMPPRMSYDAQLWRATQSMYQLFGPPVGAILESGAWISAVLLAYFVRERRPAFRWTLVGAVCMVAAQVLWWTFVNPLNAVMIHWTPESIPADWESYRAQWEYSHAVRAVIQIAGLSALVVSILSETPDEVGASPHSVSQGVVSITVR
jgi:hypothetical protein